jgi:hypothetical protein
MAAGSSATGLKATSSSGSSSTECCDRSASLESSSDSSSSSSASRSSAAGLSPVRCSLPTSTPNNSASSSSHWSSSPEARAFFADIPPVSLKVICGQDGGGRPCASHSRGTSATNPATVPRGDCSCKGRSGLGFSIVVLAGRRFDPTDPHDPPSGASLNLHVAGFGKEQFRLRG